MVFGFTDQHAMTLVSPLLFPGEQVLFRARGVEKPWFSSLLWQFGAVFWRYWLVVATNQRLVLIEHGGCFRRYAPTKNETFAWAELDRVALGWGVFNRTLRLESSGRDLARSIVVPRSWMKRNWHAAEGVCSTWQDVRYGPVLRAFPADAPPPERLAYGSLSGSRCGAHPDRSSTL